GVCKPAEQCGPPIWRGVAGAESAKPRRKRPFPCPLAGASEYLSPGHPRRFLTSLSGCLVGGTLRVPFPPPPRHTPCASYHSGRPLDSPPRGGQKGKGAAGAGSEVCNGPPPGRGPEAR